jgi:hypothetical protein
MNYDKRAIRALIIIAIVIALVGASWYWLHQPYTPPAAIQTAQQFVDYLQQENYKSAFELTVKQGYVGMSPQALSDIRQRHCLTTQYAYSSPPQSNGNRLRRWWNGNPIEQTQLNLEFTGHCLLSVRLKPQTDGTWKVYYFASHAG